MKTLKGILIRAIGLIVVAVVGVFVLTAVSNSAGSARTSLADARVTALSSAADSVIYASVDTPLAGFYRSSDGGRTWQMVSHQLDRQVNALVVSPADAKTVWAGTQGGSIALEHDSLYVSHNGGQDWTRTPLLLPANPEGRIPTVLSLAADPRDAGTIYVGTDGQGLYKMTDRGATMTALGSNFSWGRVEQVVVAAADAQQVFAVTSGGLFESRNGGDDWSRNQTLPEKAVTLAVAPSNSLILYAGTASMGAYRSDDGGQTWKAIGAGLGLVPGTAMAVNSLEVDAQNPDLVYAMPSYIFNGGSVVHEVSLGVFESRDGGQSWKQIKAGEAVGQVNAVAVAPAANGNVYLATDRGVLLANKDASNTSVSETFGAIVSGSGSATDGLAQVSIILFTAMAAAAVLLVKPAHFCRTLLSRVVRNNCNS
jgi:photosystem II stability/assembly factor-like uncharacterized protein